MGRKKTPEPVKMTQRMEVRKISELIPYENNARTHPPEQIEKLRRSLREFGFVSPVLIDAAGNVIAGHGRLLAAEMEGFETAPCVIAEHLSDAQRRAYILADNRLAELSGWDEAILGGEVLELRDEGVQISLLGFEDGEIALGDKAEDAEQYDVHEDDFDEEPPETPFTQRGQVWQLGRHRLMCGDATSTKDVQTLMGGRHADICFTSPPYNMGASAGGGWESTPNHAMNCGKAYLNTPDKLTDDEYSKMLTESVRNALEVADDVMVNLGILAGNRIGVANMIYLFRNELGEILVWNKPTSMPCGMKTQTGLVSHRCEFIFCFNKSGKKSFSHPQWDVGTMINRIDAKNGSGNLYANIHAATFSVDFAGKIVEGFSEKSVLDLFGGTGTTMIACEQTGRSCRMMELDPKYCDVIIRRWEALTGEKAVLVSE